jgi:hypothetical protein
MKTPPFELPPPHIRATKDDGWSMPDLYTAEKLRQCISERDAWWSQFVGNLLARIHRDGGHYIEEHGLAKAMEDADAKVVEWLGMQQQTDAMRQTLRDIEEMSRSGARGTATHAKLTLGMMATVAHEAQMPCA